MYARMSPSLKSMLRRRFPTGYRHAQLWVAAQQFTETGSPWARNVLNDEVLSTVIRTTLRSADACVDIGAAQGRFTDEMRKVVTSGSVFSVEAIPAAAASLALRFARHSNVEVLPIALGSERTMTDFWICDADSGYSGLRRTEAAQMKGTLSPTRVEVFPLDETSISECAVRLMKIDVEGGEFEVILGGRETIARTRPIIAFECTSHLLDYDRTPYELFDLLEDLSMSIRSPAQHLDGGPAMSRSYFSESVLEGFEFFFIAAPMSEPGLTK